MEETKVSNINGYCNRCEFLTKKGSLIKKIKQ